jgi:hypothetical protein
VTRRKLSRLTTGRLQSLRLFSTLLPITLKTPAATVTSQNSGYGKGWNILSDDHSCASQFNSVRRLESLALPFQAAERPDHAIQVPIGSSTIQSASPKRSYRQRNTRCDDMGLPREPDFKMYLLEVHRTEE